ncbi:hypothetical protein SVAN01_09434 [Stagonosporopsis vannaccii]|nr:hypothetical protein SVAN01_09434 [Stagonosporopsis vannaccii]
MRAVVTAQLGSPYTMSRSLLFPWFTPKHSHSLV